MDLIMPGMDGVEATRRIMRQSPCAILLVTASVDGNSRMVFEAVSAGALDAVATPVVQPGGKNMEGASLLLYKISSIQPVASQTPPNQVPRAARPGPVVNSCDKLVVIGASAGGPAALSVVLSGLPSEFPAAILIVQHLDAQFASGLASWLKDSSKVPVELAQAGEKPECGKAFIAATNDHLILRANGTFAYTPEPREYSYRPSVDVCFESVRRHWKGEIVGVLLTGMGRDGAQGLKGLRSAGALTIAQSRADSVVYGMPKAAAEIGAATEILTLEQIAATLTRRFAPLPSSFKTIA
jgi:chemotaxis response regulator CheB